ncbi:putative N6-adenine methyltransferase-domain-containing protein [Endogone sp. FLAS-F59071]|nr:putative N6-adenine methyltransferase-domain-containing protein [Endogone sp. FLAS-F59071]|eukprot:RUS19027.1 putative N6-adenine methyltransferase-domain-containing protein [Endogone sp. FLAS-F59071]
MSAFNNDDDDDGIPRLSSEALAALHEFISEQREQQEKLERLKQKAEEQFGEKEAADIEDMDGEEVSMNLFQEDWQVSWTMLSQFWYDEDTSLKLAQEVIDNTQGRVACISAPTAFVKLKSLKPPNTHDLFLFEFDTRFSVYKRQFIHYDYNDPLGFPRVDEFQGSVDFIIVDPPFLSEECATKTLQTAKFLARDGCKILMCTGAVMRSLVERAIGAKMTVFHPRHRGGLANEFRCYTNYASPAIPWVREDQI